MRINNHKGQKGEKIKGTTARIIRVSQDGYSR